MEGGMTINRSQQARFARYCSLRSTLLAARYCAALATVQTDVRIGFTGNDQRVLLVLRVGSVKGIKERVQVAADTILVLAHTIGRVGV